MTAMETPIEGGGRVGGPPMNRNDPVTRHRTLMLGKGRGKKRSDFCGKTRVSVEVNHQSQRWIRVVSRVARHFNTNTRQLWGAHED